MKKLTTLITAILLVFALTACGGGKTADIDLAAAADELLGSAAFTDLLSQPAAGVPAKIYGFAEENVTGYVMYYGTGATAEEIFLAEAVDAAAAEELLASCEQRIADQKTAFESYVPEEVAKLDSACVGKCGNYVYLVVSNDNTVVQNILDGYFTA